MQSSRTFTWKTLVFITAFTLLLVILARFTFNTTRALVTTWRVPGFSEEQGFAPTAPTRTPLSLGDTLGELSEGGIDPTRPIQEIDGPPNQAWDGKSRINILLMGLDHRENEDGPPRTDTLILFTMDPETSSAAILSIPRDLWVAVPGYGHRKINTAYVLGAAYEEPGGGPGLTLRTIEQFLGINIPFYAQVNFNSFIQFIDEIGGVTIEVQEEMTIDPIGPNNTLRISPGPRTMSGDEALAYARARNTANGDFDRAIRQQQVIMAIRDRVFSLEMIPILVTKAPSLYTQLAGGINTNLTLQQIVNIGLAAQQISVENIKRLSIDDNYLTYDFSPDGMFILKPIPDLIRELRDEAFASSSPVLPAVANRPIRDLVQEEAANVSVLNATSTAGLAANTTQYLKGQGVNVILTSNASRTQEYTTVIDYTGNPYTLKYLMDILNIGEAHIFHSFNAASEIDIEIKLGGDWAKNNRLP